jgi:hypothetical protein
MRQTLIPGLYFVELPPKLIIDNGTLRGLLNFRWIEIHKPSEVTFPPAASIERVDYHSLGLGKEECKKLWESDRQYRLELRVKDLADNLKNTLH